MTARGCEDTNILDKGTARNDAARSHQLSNPQSRQSRLSVLYIIGVSTQNQGPKARASDGTFDLLEELT